MERVMLRGTVVELRNSVIDGNGEDGKVRGKG